MGSWLGNHTPLNLTANDTPGAQRFDANGNPMGGAPIAGGNTNSAGSSGNPAMYAAAASTAQTPTAAVPGMSAAPQMRQTQPVNLRAALGDQF